VDGQKNGAVNRSALALAVFLVVVLLLAVLSLMIPVFPESPNSTGQSAIMSVTAPGSNGNIPSGEPQVNTGSGLVTRSFPYVLRGETGTINISISPAVYGDLAAQVPSEVCSPDNVTVPCTREVISRFYLDMANEPDGSGTLDTLVHAIREKTPVRDDQARIAISLVQHIPYGYRPSYSGGDRTMRFPSMVLYDDNGICDEKSLLLATLLGKLGYGTALLDFSADNHMVLGVKSPAAYAYNGTGYAFVETTIPLIVTDDRELYNNGTKLSCVPDIYPISDGASFDSVSEEYQDAREFIRLTKSGLISSGKFTAADNDTLRSLARKYGLDMNNAIPEIPA